MRRAGLLILCLSWLAGCALLGEDTLDKEFSADARSSSKEALIQQQLQQHFESGEKFYADGKLDEAEAQYKAMLKMAPEDDAALYRLGNIAFRRGQYADSAAYFERTVKANPRNQRAHYNLATLRLMQAENHFKYYAALAGRDTDLAKVSELLGSIDRFANTRSQDTDTQALDQIAGALKK